MTKVYAVVGANYGDEGKGLAVDYLSREGRGVVIKHNGGAQAGHTVDRADGKRFVFHQLGSGSFNHYPTFWAYTYQPDLLKIADEVEEFKAVSGFTPKIAADPGAKVVLLTDVYINQMKEINRGENKHGSCGMGIWEATVRNNAGFAITIGDIADGTIFDLVGKLKLIEEVYLPKRMKELGINYHSVPALDYIEYVKALKENLNKYVEVIESFTDCFGENLDKIIYEGAQGLMLDAARKDLWPHTTSSRTDLTNPLNISGIGIDEAVFVSRSYVTRHGAGPFKEHPGLEFEDLTNKPNPWQGSLRFGAFEDRYELVNRVKDALRRNEYFDRVSLFLTHLNEVNGIYTWKEGPVDIVDLIEDDKYKNLFDKFYLSDTKYNTRTREI